MSKWGRNTISVKYHRVDKDDDHKKNLNVNSGYFVKLTVISSVFETSFNDSKDIEIIKKLTNADMKDL